MAYRAEEFSGYFRRSLAALAGRAGREADLELLEDWIAQPPTPERIAQAVDAHVALALAGAARAVDLEAAGAAVGSALRRLRQCLMMALAERDVSGRAPLQEVCSAMTAFAAATTGHALAQAGRELVARYGRPLDGEGRPQDLLAVGMGKGGADELNVSSDLDLIFVFRDEGQTEGLPGDGGEPRPASRIASSEFMHRLARRCIALLAETTADGFVFRVDTRLRPNGDSGPLVVSLSMLEDYFFVQGREWERFAWLKGKVIADSGIAGEQARSDDEQALASIVRPFVFRRYLDFRAFAALRDLHALIRAEVAKRDARSAGSIDVKLGRGGIREVEFIAQLFQVVRGGRDPALRDRRTLATLATLGERGLLPAADAAQLRAAYELLRRTEHALQYREDAQTHRLPADPADRAVVAGMLGMDVEAFGAALEQARNAVQRVFDDLLQAPDRGEAADVSEPGEGQSQAAGHSDAVQQRLAALRSSVRYRSAREDTRAALEKLLARALSQRGGDAGVARLIDLVEAVIGRPAYIALLSQFPQAQARVTKLLGKAKWAADYLIRHPIVLDELLDGQVLGAADYAAWERTVREALDAPGHDGALDVERQMDVVREAHHAQVFRLLVQDLEGLHTVERRPTSSASWPTACCRSASTTPGRWCAAATARSRASR
jgi:glutamate-ammonia-ligase adenylyltransferase